MKKSIIWASLLAIAVFAWIGSGQFGGAKAPAAKSEKPADVIKTASVRVQTIVAQQRFQELIMTGVTEASRKVTLRAETKGRIVAAPVREGQMVKTGTPVVRLAIDDRKARLAEAKARLNQYQIKYDAARQLAKRSFRSKVQFAESAAELKSAEASLANIELDIRRTEVRAPFEGVLESRSVEIGDFLDIGDPIASVVDLDPVLVVTEVTERDVGGISVGTVVQARLVTGVQVAGKVSQIATVATSETRTFRVEVTVDNPDRAISDGLTTEVKIPTQEITAHRVSPAILTLSDEGTVGIKTVNGESRVEFHRVEIKQDTPEGVWVIGLPATSRVITVGQEFVRVGDTVNIIENNTAAAPDVVGSKS